MTKEIIYWVIKIHGNIIQAQKMYEIFTMIGKYTE